MGDTVQLRILGTIFTIQTDQRPDYVESLVEYLKEKIRLIEGSTGSKESLRTAILVALLVSDELFQERAKPSRSSDSDQEIESLALRLIDRIDEVLDESSVNEADPRK